MKLKTNKSNSFFNKVETKYGKKYMQEVDELASAKILKIKLAQLRETTGKKQSDIFGFSQASISKIESRNDMKVSTLIDYIHALGMEIEIKASNKSNNKKILLLKG